MYCLENFEAFYWVYGAELVDKDYVLMWLPRAEVDDFFSTYGRYNYTLISNLMNFLRNIDTNPGRNERFLSRTVSPALQEAKATELSTVDMFEIIPKLSLVDNPNVSPGFQNFCRNAPLNIHPDVIAVAYYFSELGLFGVGRDHPNLPGTYRELLLDADQKVIDALWKVVDSSAQEDKIAAINTIFEHPDQIHDSTPPSSSLPSASSSPHREGYPPVSVGSAFPTPTRQPRPIEAQDMEGIAGDAYDQGQAQQDGQGQAQEYEYQDQDQGQAAAAEGQEGQHPYPAGHILTARVRLFGGNGEGDHDEEVDDASMEVDNVPPPHG